MPPLEPSNSDQHPSFPLCIPYARQRELSLEHALFTKHFHKSQDNFCILSTLLFCHLLGLVSDP